MHRSDTNANRLTDWGNGLMGKLPARSRGHRLRIASKRRRVMLKRMVREVISPGCGR